MSNEALHARHLVELGFLQDAVGEMGMSSRIIERTGDLAYHTLLVDLEPDARRRPRQLALNYYPLEDDEFSDSLFLQYFIILPYPLKQSSVAAVAQVLPYINNKVVVGHFGIGDGEPQLHFRYVQVLPSDDVMSTEKVADVLTLVGYTPLLFDSILEGLVDGSLTPEAALKQVDRVYAGQS